MESCPSILALSVLAGDAAKGSGELAEYALSPIAEIGGGVGFGNLDPMVAIGRSCKSELLHANAGT